jgi:hypothetical protein
MSVDTQILPKQEQNIPKTYPSVLENLICNKYNIYFSRKKTNNRICIYACIRLPQTHSRKREVEGEERERQRDRETGRERGRQRRERGRERERGFVMRNWLTLM